MRKNKGDYNRKLKNNFKIMMAKNPEFSEAKAEHIPTYEEVIEIIRQLAGSEYKETQKIEDENGLCRLDIETPGELADEKTEYNYLRKEGSYTDISVAYYVDDIPTGGKLVARFVDGEWVIKQ